MSQPTDADSSPLKPSDSVDEAPSQDRHHVDASFFAGQFWVVAKNVIGWLLLISTPAVGLLPGPGGIATFIIGFALVSFPGKRRLTSRVMRGKPVRVSPKPFLGIATALSIIVCGVLVYLFDWKKQWVLQSLGLQENEKAAIATFIVAVGILAMVTTWVFMKLALFGVNVFIRGLPIARRFVRPWLKRKGINFLPPRRLRVGEDVQNINFNEILTVSKGNQTRAINAANFFVRWGKRSVGIGITIAIFWFILTPVIKNWQDAAHQLSLLSPVRVAASVLMFMTFLIVFRAMAWRAIVWGFGYKLPVAPALRIWLTSELARYIPGAIWQVMSRVKLAKPYGIRGSVISTSQVLELSIFLLANLIIAVACLCWLGVKTFPGPAQTWLIAAMCMTPFLGLLLLPGIFYGTTDRILSQLGKPPIARRLGKRQAFLLLAWYGLGLLLQSMAIWLMLSGPLELPLSKWWVVAGSYCLAWSAGFLAVWAPGGIGVREIVLMGALTIAMPPALREVLGPDVASAAAITGSIAFLLRAWTILAELLLTPIVYWFDWRGAIGRGIEPVQCEVSSDTVAADVADASD